MNKIKICTTGITYVHDPFFDYQSSINLLTILKSNILKFLYLGNFVLMIKTMQETTQETIQDNCLLLVNIV